MDKRDLQKLLSQPYKQENWKEIIQFVFPNVSILSSPKEFPIHNDKIKRFRQIGSVRLNDGKNLALFELLLADSVNIQRNRVELNNEISKYIDQEQIHGVLSVFEQGTDDYRFTFSARSTEFDEEESDFVQKKTDTKRFTYVLGKNESCKTPADRFYKLSENKDDVDINAIQHAFSVEQLSKEFFDKYKKQFDKFWKYIASKEEYKNVFHANDQEKQEIKIRNFTKKLLGRIVFLHFLQKKGWLGCTAGNVAWEDGDKQFMQNLYKGYNNKEQFHSNCLAELFYNTLNAKRENNLFTCDELEGPLNNSKVPYLNGGLFDSDNAESKKIDFPKQYFEDLFEFFGQYNFTIDENDPNDHEVGIDPEMLGHIFENLLEDNKDKGAFYTPKVIVQYMCQESLIEYLATKLNTEVSGEVKQAIEDLIRNRLAEDISDLDLVEPIAKALYDVKVCDPAIGSGAFPMGILNVIYYVIEALYWIQPDSVARVWNISDKEWQPHLVKKNIIQHSIYGVDIESGAVDIARLRFWLALVVDEIEPLPLPNLDYKIMQGNSLLESFEGIDLSQISDASAYEAVYESEQIDIFSGEAKKKVSMSLNFEDIKTLMDQYFNADDPNTKKDLHKRIDEQVLNHIYFTLSELKKTIKKKANKLEKKLILDEAAARTWEQKEKIRTSSKGAKVLSKLNKTLSEYDEKENKLAQLSNSNERPFFLWHLFFQEVFDNGGFDIVIGNPPYVDSETMTNNNPEERIIYKTIYETAKGNWDLFIVFIEKGIKLTNDNGVFSYIIPNKLIGAKYSLKSKEFMSKYSIFDIRDYSRLNVFKEASVYPITINLSKNSSHNSVKLSKINSAYNILSTKTISYSVFKSDLLWDKYFNNEDVVSLILKLLENRQLRDFDNYSILGSATVSEAYLIKDKLIDNNSVSKSFKKLINTGTIDKYQSLWGIKNTQYIKDAYLHPVISKNNIEEINKTRLTQANSPKIIIAGMSIDIEGVLDEHGEFLAGKSTSIILNENNNSHSLMWLLTILNSKVVSYFLKISYHSLKMSGGYLNIGNEVLKNIPIPILEKHHKLKLIDFAKQFNNSKETYEGHGVKFIKTEMYVAKLYKLTFNELKLVYPEITITINESIYSNFSLDNN
ncbi:Eco57I restriction-modification methylase domain-containing protein [Patiriisocius sp. Uisw_017]|uniref:Eco57I restriction-modification methylase domain-containing protein n=1 Tax=Patiriisocius sp. Uisw_017 TaxID=3230968 RepID=UPI0039E83D5D